MTTYRTTFSPRRLWTILGISMFVMFSVLLYFGRQIYHQAPPIPETVEVTGGEVLFTGEDILQGQHVWQSMGGMQQGSIWGHGSYVAPDWSADWLHREALAMLNILAVERQSDYRQLDSDAQESLKIPLRAELRNNTYDESTGTLTVSSRRARAIGEVKAHYVGLFGDEASDELALF